MTTSALIASPHTPWNDSTAKMYPLFQVWVILMPYNASQEKSQELFFLTILYTHKKKPSEKETRNAETWNTPEVAHQESVHSSNLILSFIIFLYHVSVCQLLQQIVGKSTTFMKTKIKGLFSQRSNSQTGPWVHFNLSAVWSNKPGFLSLPHFSITTDKLLAEFQKQQPFQSAQLKLYQTTPCSTFIIIATVPLSECSVWQQDFRPPSFCEASFLLIDSLWKGSWTQGWGGGASLPAAHRKSLQPSGISSTVLHAAAPSVWAAALCDSEDEFDEG